MSQALIDQLKFLPYEVFPDDQVQQRFKERLDLGHLYREEDDKSHFCVFFLPVHKESQKIFLGHHINANTWLAPGGHLDIGESLADTVKREAKEELTLEVKKVPEPFLVTIKDIQHSRRSCQTHFDIWHVLELENQELKADDKEYYITEWMTLPLALELVKDQNNLLAFEKVRQLYGW